MLVDLFVFCGILASFLDWISLSVPVVIPRPAFSLSVNKQVGRKILGAKIEIVTQKSIEVWLHNKCHKIYLSGPFGIFCLYVILTISYLRAQTIETSLLPTDSTRPLFKQIEIFSYIDCMSVYFNCKYFP